MIIKIEMLGCQCDNCGEQWIDENNGFAAFADEFGIKDSVGDDDQWHTEFNYPNDKHYCKECWSFDSEDNLIIRKIEKIKK